MIPVGDNSRKFIVRKRENRTCICCLEKVQNKESDVYEFDFSPSLKRDKYAILCDKCKQAIERYGTPDDEVPNWIAGLHMNIFLSRIGGLPYDKKA